MSNRIIFKNIKNCLSAAPTLQEFAEGSDLQCGEFAWRANLSAIPAVQEGPVRIASMPDGRCFWHAIIALLVFVGTPEEIRILFITIAHILAGSERTESEKFILAFTRHFAINYLPMDKFLSIFSHGAEKKYDFNRPTIIYVAEGKTGHIGLSTSGKGRLCALQVLSYLENTLASKPVIPQTQNLPKSKSGGKVPLLWEAKTAKILFYEALARAVSNVARLPLTGSEENEAEAARYHAAKSCGFTYAYKPVTIDSQRCVAIYTASRKHLYPYVWAPKDPTVKQVCSFDRQFGMVRNEGVPNALAFRLLAFCTRVARAFGFRLNFDRVVYVINWRRPTMPFLQKLLAFMAVHLFSLFVNLFFGWWIWIFRIFYSGIESVLVRFAQSAIDTWLDLAELTLQEVARRFKEAVLQFLARVYLRFAQLFWTTLLLRILAFARSCFDRALALSFGFIRRAIAYAQGIRANLVAQVVTSAQSVIQTCQFWINICVQMLLETISRFARRVCVNLRGSARSLSASVARVFRACWNCLAHCALEFFEGVKIGAFEIYFFTIAMLRRCGVQVGYWDRMYACCLRLFARFDAPMNYLQMLVGRVINGYHGYIPKYTKKLVSEASLERLSDTLIASIHVRKTFVGKNRNEETRGGLSVRGGKVVSILTGDIDKSMNSVYQSFGYGFTGEEIAKASIESGGHSHARAIVDRMQSEMLERMCLHIEQCFRDGAREFTVIDVGAKFGKISGVLEKRLAPSQSFFFRPIKVDEPRRIAADRVMDVLWPAIEASIFRRTCTYANLEAILHNNPFTINANGVNLIIPLSEAFKLIDEPTAFARIAMQGAVKYQPVRPRVGDYNVNYYSKEGNGYFLRGQEAHRVHAEVIVRCAPFEGTIEDFEAQQPAYNHLVAYLLFDVHYYLSAWTPSCTGEVFIVGGEFPSSLGMYELPMGEGSFSISYDAERYGVMSMITSSSGTPYIHPLTHVVNPESRIDYGWYAHVAHQCSTRALRLKRVRFPAPFSPEQMVANLARCPQAQFFLKLMESFSTVDLKSFKDFARKWSAYKSVAPYRICDPDIDVVKDYVLMTHDFRTGNAAVALFEEYPFFIEIPRLWIRATTGFDICAPSESIVITPNAWMYGHDHRVASRGQELSPEEIFDRRFGCLAETDASISGALLSKAQLCQYARRDVAPNQEVKLLRSKKVARNYGVVVNPDLVHYFMVKPAPTPRILSLNYSLNEESAAYKQRVCDKFIRFCASFDRPVKWSNAQDKYVDCESEVETCSTGYALASGLSEYEWCSRALNHIGSAMYDRHLMPNIMPDPAHVKKFSQMCDRYFKYLVPLIEKGLEGVEFDPFAILMEKEFPKGKMQRYYVNLCEQLQGTLGMSGSFKTMVKSGEVYYGNDFQFEKGCLVGVSDRPRNIMVPSESLCGLLTMIQSCLWAPLKKACPEFIQGYTKEDLTDSFLDGITDDWKSICLDGSGFDSTQHWQCMDACDNKFMQLLSPSLTKLMRTCKEKYPGLTAFDPEYYVRKLLESATSNVNYCFSEVPLIGKDEPWPQDAARRFEQDWLRSLPKYSKTNYQENFIPNIINGTVFSGHPTKTTLGNTMRSICYAFYYMQMAGISEPWLNKLVKVRAAGDDVVILCARLLQEKIANVIATLSSRTNRNEVATAPIGLGQCIKRVDRGEWYELDFCSKWCQGTSTNDFHLTRDVKKILVTKLFYTKKNQLLLTRPAVHARAIYEGFKSEKVSRLVEDILQFRYQMFGDNVTEEEGLDFFKANYFSQIALGAEDGYSAEEEVNSRLGLSLKDLFDLVDARKLNL